MSNYFGPCVSWGGEFLVIVTLIKKQRISTWYLPSEVKGQFWVSDKNIHDYPRKLLSIEGVSGKWFIRSYRSVQISDISGREIRFAEMVPASFYRLSFGDTEEPALLFCEEVTEGRLNFKKYTIDSTEGVNITIGRTPQNTIVYDNKFVSSIHCTLMYHNGRWTIQDNKSGNGTFVNNYAVSSCSVKPGDSIFVLGLTIIIGSNFIAINNPSGSVALNSKVFRPYQPENINLSKGDSPSEQHEYEVEYFYRSPRFKRELEKAQFAIDAPPQTPIGDEMPMILLLGPSITMGFAALAMGSFAVMNAIDRGSVFFALPQMVMSFSMLMGAVLWPTLSRRYQKKRAHKKEAVRQERYRAYLEDVERHIQEECAKQEEILRENFIPVADCAKRIAERSIKLWERSTEQNDFLQFRVGIGESDLVAEFKAPEKKFFLDDDTLRDELFELCDKPKKLHNVPITISLSENRFTSVIGERSKCLNFANGLIIQLTALYGYDDVKTVFLYDEMEKSELGYTKWLPHVWSNDNRFRMIATNMNELKEVSAYMEKEIEARKELDDARMNKAIPHYVIFIFSRELALRAEMLKQLYALEKRVNISVISFFDELKNVPKECSAVIELEGLAGKIFDKNDTSGQFVNFINDIAYTGDMVAYSVNLANIALDVSGGSYQLPQLITFLEMFGVNKVEHLNPPLRWKENDPTKSLQAPVGVNTLGDLFYLDLHEKFHGPHGLVAGMTGSGKSEFIITYILSLALNYHPDEVAFILIDYKGGGMAKAFETLPHVAGIITNLDGPAIKRSLVSIESELKHRQAVFAQASKQLGTSNIDIYKYQKAYRNGQVTEPLPHLFIISDEFAELKTQQPEFMTQLVSTARIGRSLGVHLILATQKPSGVVDDQIWSNSKFKVCLKVQDRSDSMEMLKRPDAAELSDTGRFYLQIGYNELFEMGQSAWAGANYTPDDGEVQHNDCSISVIDINGYVLQSVKRETNRTEDVNPKKQLDVITDYIFKTAQDEDAFTRQLWLPPIAPIILLQDLHKTYPKPKEAPYILNPLIGEIDDPARQRRLPLYMPISADGNAIIYGFAGSGKATFLTTMLYDLLSSHCAETLNVYIMDFGAETLRIFEKAPQVGDVVFSSDSEKIVNLLKMLRKEVATRKKLFSEWGGDIASYCATSGSTVPNILVVINNYSAFSEGYEDCEEYIYTLSQEGTKYGIYFILTANNSIGVRYRLLQNFKQLFVLQLNDNTEYAGILGHTGGVFPAKIKGRGLIKADEIYEFQTAHIADPEHVAGDIRGLCAALLELPEVKHAKSIPILPERVIPEFFNNIQVTMKRFPVGVNKHNLNIEYLDLASSFITLIVATDVDSTIPVAQGLAEMLSGNAGVNTVVLDVDTSFEPDVNREYQYFNQDIEDVVISLLNLVEERQKAYKNNGATNFEEVVYVIPALSGLYKSLSEEGASKLNELLENGDASHGISAVISDGNFDVQSHARQSWYRIHCAGNGIWVGDGVMNQYDLKISKPSNELYDEIGSTFGTLIHNGKYKIAKLLQSYTVKGEDEDE